MEEFDFHPQKPELVEHTPKSSLSLTVFSLVLFVLVYMLFFGSKEFNFIVYLMVVLILHELGHFVAMKFFKYENVRMLFVPLMGAFVQGKKKNYSEKQSMWVIISGPFPGVIIGSILMWYSCAYHVPWMIQLAALFLLLNVINLLPLDPLDGGQLLKLFAKKRHEMFLMIFSFMSSIAVIATGAYIVMMKDSTLGYWAVVFGFLMGFRVRAMQKQYLMHKELKESKVNYSTTYKMLSNKDYMIIKNVVVNHTPQLQKYVDQISEEQADPLFASQVNSVLVAPLNSDTSIWFKFVVLTCWIASFTVPFLVFFLSDTDWIWPVFFM